MADLDEGLVTIKLRPRRPRSRRWSEATKREARRYFGVARVTPRHESNLCAAYEAARILQSGWDGYDYGWLFHPRPRISLLAALGRFESSSEIREVARVLCEVQPRSEEAERTLRSGRFPVRPDRVETLELALRKQVRLARLRGLVWNEVIPAVESLLADCHAARRSEPGPSN